jgi:hypothetical protein
VTTTSSPCTFSTQHDWQPIDGWCARYRCKECRIVGYRPRVVTLGVEGGPFGRIAITPYVCGATRDGERCGGPAEWKQKGTWRCGEHLLNNNNRTAAARAAHPKTKSATRPVVPALAPAAGPAADT